MRHSKKTTVIERYECLEDLISKGGTNLVKDLKKALSDRSPRIRSLAAEAVGDSQARALFPELINMLNDSNSMVLISVIESIGELAPKQSAMPCLSKHLRHKHEVVRICAAEALGYVGDLDSLPALESVLSDSSPLVRSYAADAIGMIGVPNYSETLVKHLEIEREDRAKLGFYKALFVLGNHSYLTLLLDLLKSSDYLTRSASAYALADLKLNARERDTVQKILKQRLRKEQYKTVTEAIKDSLSALDVARS